MVITLGRVQSECVNVNFACCTVINIKKLISLFIFTFV